MYIEPNTVIKILKDCPLDNSYDHTIFFTSASAQFSFFSEHTKYTLDKQSYQRVKRGYMRVSIQAENLYDCNYLMFQNTSFGTKWFYAFIKSVEYVNNVTSEIEFEIDVMQTWFFDYTFKKSFVEREHATNDAIGANTVPERLELGDYVSDDFDGTAKLGELSIVVAATFQYFPESKEIRDMPGTMYGGVYSGLCYNAFPTTPTGAAGVTELIQEASSAGKDSGIVAIFMMPTNMLVDSYGSAKTYKITKSKNINSLGSYTPRNNKLYTYPYNFLYVTNIQGNSASYPYEYFSGSTCEFTLGGDCSPNPSCVLYPINYKGVAANLDEKLSLSGWPQCAYNTDAFKAWLAQNGASLATSALSTGMGADIAIAGALAMTNPVTAGVAIAGATVSMISKVASTLATVYEHSIMPRQAHGSTGNTTMAALRILDFAFMHKHIKPEYAEIIDGYFDMYGYATNRVKIPNRNGRPHWNYVKVLGAVLVGSVPADDMKLITNIYEKGITFWNNGYEVGNYSLDNSL